MTPEEAAVFWEELQRGLRFVHCVRQPPSHRRRRMGEMRVTMTESPREPGNTPMNPETLRSEADALLKHMSLVPPRQPGEKLRPIDEATILEMASAGSPRSRSPRRSGVIRAR
jgi:hypothetical protein